MILVHISDSHLTPDPPAGARRRSDLARTVAAINAMDPQPDVVIHTGDLANRGQPEEYRQARHLLGELQAPVYVVPGNRDDRDGLRDAFAMPAPLEPGAPFVQFAVEDHPVRLLGLDTRSETSQKGHYCDARHAALVDALARDPERPTLIFAHHPPFYIAGAAEPYRFQFESQEQAQRLVATLAQAGPTARVVCGHTHRAWEVRLGEVTASTVPSTAVDLRLYNESESESPHPRFHVLRYHDDGGFTTEAVEAAV
jgi:3',5'-cyclic AMP phosphodiesterase CpdA